MKKCSIFNKFFTIGQHIMKLIEGFPLILRAWQECTMVWFRRSLTRHKRDKWTHKVSVILTIVACAIVSSVNLLPH
jgi:hypothetical protein